MKFPLAIEGPQGNVITLDCEWLKRGVEASRQSPRRRVMMTLHRRPEGVQRMLNFLQPGTYIRPHRHPLPGHAECLAVVQGSLAVMEFNAEGAVVQICCLRAGQPDRMIVDIDAGIWHGLVTLEPDTVILEIKHGPYDTARDKEFPAWAPEEGSAEAALQLQRWTEAARAM